MVNTLTVDPVNTRITKKDYNGRKFDWGGLGTADVGTYTLILSVTFN